MKSLEIGPGTNPLINHDTIDYCSEYSPTYLLDITAHDWLIPESIYDRVTTIHVFEHVELKYLVHIFQNVYRIMKPGGRFQVHVPNGPAICRAYLNFPDKRYYTQDGGTMNLAFYGAESESKPKYHLGHKTLFDSQLLSSCFSSTGFINIVDLTEQVEDIHDTYWNWIGERFSLKIQGTKPV